MRWIDNASEYADLRLKSRDCVLVDGIRESSPLSMLVYHDLEGTSSEFASLLNKLMAIANDLTCYYMVLDPDPEYFWKDRLGHYAVFEMNRGDSGADYLRFLNEPLDPRGGAMSTMWYDYVIFSPGLKWFARALCSNRDDSGHLWIPREWIAEAQQAYPWLTQRNPGECPPEGE